MALISVTELSDDVRLGLWKLDETLESYMLAYPHLENILSVFRNPDRKRQKLTVYALLHAMTGNYKNVIEHDINGKPLLEGFYISISDTKDYVAVILSKTKNVAVDIEYFSHRVNRIASRFIREDECAETTEMQLVHWSTKETVFKYFSSQHLQYGDMRLSTFDLNTEGIVWVENLKGGVSIPVHYHVNDKYILTYAY